MAALTNPSADAVIRGTERVMFATSGSVTRVAATYSGTAQGSIDLCASGEAREAVYELRLKVSDTGIGMTPEQCARVFAAFEQQDPETFLGEFLGGPAARDTGADDDCVVRLVRHGHPPFLLLVRPVAQRAAPL